MNRSDPRYGTRAGLGALMLALLCGGAGQAAATEILGRHEARLGAPAGLVLQLPPGNGVLNTLCTVYGSSIGGGAAGCRALGATSAMFSPIVYTRGVALGAQTLIAGTSGLANHPHMRLNTAPQVLDLSSDDGRSVRLSVALISAGVGYFTSGEGNTLRALPNNSGSCQTARMDAFGHAGPRGWSNFLSHASGDGPATCRAGELMGVDNVPIEPGRTFNTEVSLQSLSYRVQVLDGSAVPNGVYRGTLDVRVGAGGDLDVGSDGGATVQVAFQIEMVNEMVVHFPDGSASTPAALTPEGGWLLNPTPTSLRRDLPLVFGTTLPMSIQLRCQHYAGDRCAIARRDGGGTPVPVNVAASLPGYRLRDTGAPVQRSAIPTDRAPGPRLQLEAQTDTPRRSAGAHLRVHTDAAATAEMLTHPGSYYEGNVTVIFESMP